MLDYYGSSDVGLVRRNNEDVWDVIKEHSFFSLADGMGGHRAGEVAAKNAINHLRNEMHNHLSSHPNNDHTHPIIEDYLQRAIVYANNMVYSLSTEIEQYKGMGTTLCCMHVYKNILTHAHVGDSRIYKYCNNSIFQLTKDHSLIDKQAKKNHLHPLKNVITKAIGTTKSVTPSISSIPIESNDIFFMCTDGLSDYVLPDEMIFILQRASSIQFAVEKLIEAAKKNQSHDNITILMIKIK